jgi:hypothetical protein
MKLLTLTKAVLALALPSLVTLGHAAGIAGSAHDFTAESWNVNKDVCGPCHMAHGSDPNNQFIPLWSHETDNAPFQPFVSPHGTAIGDPDGASRACLSCHDGTLAYNQLKGRVPTGQSEQFVLGDYVIGGGHDLRGDHPVSFLYSAAVNASPTNTLKLASEILGGAYNPGNNTGGTLPVGNNLQGQTVGQAFLRAGKMQCTSCHDVHRSIGDAALQSGLPLNAPNHNPLLVVFNGGGRLDQSGFGSSLCRSCHKK